MSKFVAQQADEPNVKLPIGLHLMKIVHANEQEKLSKGANWDDPSNEVEVKFKCDKGTIMEWYHLDGYQKKADFIDEDTGEQEPTPKGCTFKSSDNYNEDYLVNKKTNERVKSKAHTETARGLFQKFANKAGIPVGEGFDTDDLVGLEVAIMVKAGDDASDYNQIHWIDVKEKATELEIAED